MAYQAPAGITLDHDLGLKVWSNEILAEYIGDSVLLSNIRSQVLEKGAVSASFPSFGQFGPFYHQPGDNITTAAGNLLTAEQGEKVIYADRPLVAPFMIDSLQEVLTKAPMRQEYATNTGRELAAYVDKNIARTMWKASGVAAGAEYAAGTSTPQHPGGFRSKFANGTGKSVITGVTAADIMDFILDAGQRFDENNVPEEDRFVALLPQHFRAIMDITSSGNAFLSQDYMSSYDSAEGKFPMFNGFKLIKTNHIPVGSDAGSGTNVLDSSKGNDYNDAVTLSAGVHAWQKNAIGALRIADVSLETEYLIEYQADLIVPKVITGVGYLRSEAVASLELADS